MAMVDAPGAVQKCPICDSANVRWRGRRLYDVPLTWSRWFVEMFTLNLIRSTSPRRVYRGPATVRRQLQQEHLEAQTGRKTATRFWRCPDCKNHGEVFDAEAKRGRVEDRTRPPQ
jgi:hypothetical protein